MAGADERIAMVVEPPAFAAAIPTPATAGEPEPPSSFALRLFGRCSPFITDRARSPSETEAERVAPRRPASPSASQPSPLPQAPPLSMPRGAVGGVTAGAWLLAAGRVGRGLTWLRASADEKLPSAWCSADLAAAGPSECTALSAGRNRSGESARRTAARTAPATSGGTPGGSACCCSLEARRDGLAVEVVLTSVLHDGTSLGEGVSSSCCSPSSSSSSLTCSPRSFSRGVPGMPGEEGRLPLGEDPTVGGGCTNTKVPGRWRVPMTNAYIPLASLPRALRKQTKTHSHAYLFLRSRMKRLRKQTNRHVTRPVSSVQSLGVLSRFVSVSVAWTPHSHTRPYEFAVHACWLSFVVGFSEMTCSKC